jgi:hypothetical protein
VGDRRVLKPYPTVSTPDSLTEARVLDYLNGRLPVATPELLAHGEYENGWRYPLMSQLPGTELAAAWPAQLIRANARRNADRSEPGQHAGPGIGGPPADRGERP